MLWYVLPVLVRVERFEVGGHCWGCVDGGRRMRKEVEDDNTILEFSDEEEWSVWRGQT